MGRKEGSRGGWGWGKEWVRGKGREQGRAGREVRDNTRAAEIVTAGFCSLKLELQSQLLLGEQFYSLRRHVAFLPASLRKDKGRSPRKVLLQAARPADRWGCGGCDTGVCNVEVPSDKIVSCCHTCWFLFRPRVAGNRQAHLQAYQPSTVP